MTITPGEIPLLKELEQHKFELEKQLNEIQQQHEIALELQRQEYRSKEIGFIEAGLHLRSHNQFMWQVPGITIAVTGGLWYGVSLWTNDAAKQFALMFVALFDFSMIFVLYRMRRILERYIEQQKNSNLEIPLNTHGTNATIFSWIFAWSHWNFLVVGIWSVLLAIAGILSVVGIFHPERITSMKIGSVQTTLLPNEAGVDNSDSVVHLKLLPLPMLAVSGVDAISSAVTAAKAVK